MKTAAAILLIAVLSACGGGGDDAQPDVVLYEATVTASGALAQGERPRSRWTALLRGPDMQLGRETSGQACFEGEWVQTGADAAPVRLDVQSSAPVVMSAPLQLSGSVVAGQVLTVPFRVCRAYSGTTGIVQPTATVEIVTTGGASFALGAYSLRARWVYSGR